MPNPYSQFSPNLQNRYTNTQRSRHTRFDQGMMRDVASWELPEGASYDLVDMLCDYVGKTRKRGGTTSPSSSNRAAVVESLASYKSNGLDAVTGIAGGSTKSTIWSRFDRTTGASSALDSFSVGAILSRPFQHRNWLVISGQATSPLLSTVNRNSFWGGATTTTNLFPAAGTVTAGDNRITGLSSLTSAYLGAYVNLTNAANTNIYAGRVIEITSATAIRVDPTPTAGFTVSAAGSFPSVIAVAGAPSYTGVVQEAAGRYGVSFQGRMVLGDMVMPTSAVASDFRKGVERFPRRLCWGILPTESAPVSGVTMDGDNTILPGAFMGVSTPLYNWTEISTLQSMTGLAAIGDGQLVIFGPQQMFRLSGQLATETVANNSLSYSVDQVSSNIGSVTAKSLQYARGGLVFAGYDNLYEYDGSTLKPLLQGRNARYFQDRLRAGETIHGSAYAGNRNHYLLSMSGADGALMLNLDTLALTRTGNVDLFDSCADPDDATKLWGARWWDTTGAAPTMTKGQLIGLESIWLPTSANKNDADGTAVLGVVKSAAYVNGALASNKMTADVNVTADLRGTAATATVKADTKLNVADASFTTIGTFPTGTAAGSKSFPVGYQVAEGPAIEIQIGNDIACDSFELLGFDFGTQGRPEEFSS